MWKPRKIGAKFWYISMFLMPVKRYWLNHDETSLSLIETGNCFRTKQDALRAIDLFRFNNKY